MLALAQRQPTSPGLGDYTAAGARSFLFIVHPAFSSRSFNRLCWIVSFLARSLSLSRAFETIGFRTGKYVRRWRIFAFRAWLSTCTVLLFTRINMGRYDNYIMLHRYCVRFNLWLFNLFIRVKAHAIHSYHRYLLCIYLRFDNLIREQSFAAWF